MRRRAVLIALPAVIILVLTPVYLFPDATYSCYAFVRYDSRQWARHWIQVIHDTRTPAPLPPPPHIGRTESVLLLRKSGPPRQYVDPDGYAVMGMWVHLMGFDKGPILIGDEAQSQLRRADGCFSSDDDRELQEAADAFRLEKAKQHRFERRFGLQDYRLFKSRLRGNSGWPTFTFSVPAFNSTRTTAFGWVEYSCGPRCGGSEYYLMQRRNGAWILVGHCGAEKI